MTRRVVVVGGGIVGLAVAHRLLEIEPRTAVTLVEKEQAVGLHQTGHNSGVVHTGLYYQPGSLKAQLCSTGRLALLSFCERRSIAFEVCGKLVVAVRASELGRLRVLFERGLKNEVPGLRLLDAQGIRDIEPHVRGLQAIYAPTASIVSFAAVAGALAEEVRERGELWVGTEVTSVASGSDGKVALQLRGDHAGRLTCDVAVVCAGLQSDRLASRSGADAGPRVIPFRGEYYRLRPAARSLVRGLVYPVPDPRYPFLGVHLTRTVSGEVLVGPNAFLALARERYERWSIDWRDLYDTLSWPGFARFARSNWRAGVREFQHTASRRSFANEARRYVPELSVDDLEPAAAGIRAQAMARDGSLVDDFVLSARGHVLDVRNAPSPAATASFAIAEYLCRQAGLG
jgi:L-2-hydroxyglutarate oxidase LhgO